MQTDAKGEAVIIAPGGFSCGRLWVRGKTITYKADTCRCPTWHLALIGMDWFARYQDNMTEWILLGHGASGLVFQ